MMECACVCVHVCRFLWRVMEESALMCLGYTYESWQQWCHGSTTSTCPPCVWEKKGKSKRETVCVRLSIRSQEIADGQWGGSLSYCLYMCVLGLAARIEFNRCTARHISSLVLFSLLFYTYTYLSILPLGQNRTFSLLWNYSTAPDMKSSIKQADPAYRISRWVKKRQEYGLLSDFAPHLQYWSHVTKSIKLRGGLNKFNFWHKKRTYLIFQKTCNNVWKTLLLYLTTECYDWRSLASPSG